jgi:putative SOS response-associated peptidase YedK
MCGRYSIAVEPAKIERRFGAIFGEPFKRRYNAAPSQKLPVILNYNPRKLLFTRWGMKPAWFAEVFKRDGLINVRVETLRDKHTFLKDLEERRCLIPADGFYEWKTVQDEKTKRPYRITRKDGKLFAFAGIWENNDEDGKREPHFAIITTHADAFMQPIHSRMPVMLDEADESVWLSEQARVPDLLGILEKPSAHELQAYEVSRSVNKASVDDSSVFESASPIDTNASL